MPKQMRNPVLGSISTFNLDLFKRLNKMIMSQVEGSYCLIFWVSNIRGVRNSAMSKGENMAESNSKEEKSTYGYMSLSLDNS